MFPPDNYGEWAASCALLSKLHGIRTLCVDMIVWDTSERVDMTAVEDDALVAILEPLNQVSAPVFEVELNLALPENVLAKLGKLAFTLTVRKRPYDRVLFPL